MKKLEIKINELKKEFTEQEADALALALLNCRDIYISHGATLGDQLRARRSKTQEAAGELFGLPYISASVEGEAAALWNTNTSAELLGVSSFRFLGVAVGIGGEFVGLFQEHNEQGEEVGAVRCLILEHLGEFVRIYNKKKHEAERVAHIEEINAFRAKAREVLPKACQVLESYRGKRWGEVTRRQIWDSLRELNGEGLTVSASWGSYWLDIEITKSRRAGLSVSFSWRFDYENNTPAEEITPSAKHWEKVATIDTKTHRQKIGGIIEEIEKTAEKLGQLIEAYNEEARGKGYYKADNLSKWGLNLADLTRRELDA